MPWYGVGPKTNCGLGGALEEARWPEGLGEESEGVWSRSPPGRARHGVSASAGDMAYRPG